jgi:hypothetical protein
MHTLASVCAEAQVSATPWRVMLVSPGDAGFEDAAVVVVSALLAKAGISIMYQSTFTTDLLLVPVPDTSRAITILEFAGFEVSSLVGPQLERCHTHAGCGRTSHGS